MIQGLDQRAATIYAPIRARLTEVERRLRNLSENEIPQLEPLLSHVLSSGGKRVRPAITLLAADCYPHTTDNPITMAVAVELLHLATLIHDDTVDNSAMRRGKETVSARWGKHVAVLLGDYIFATSATFVCDTGNVRVVRRFSETIMELASGELVEYFTNYCLTNPEEARALYHDRIYRKTASLFCTSAESGALLAGAPESHAQAFRDYGYNIGMAFQLVDDILDIQGNPLELGKPVGNDLLQGVLTLPAIMLLERYPEANPIADLFRDRSRQDKLHESLDMLHHSGIIAECFALIRQYCEAASRSLSITPACPARESLLTLSDYIWERSR